MRTSGPRLVTCLVSDVGLCVFVQSLLLNGLLPEDQQDVSLAVDTGNAEQQLVTLLWFFPSVFPSFSPTLCVCYRSNSFSCSRVRDTGIGFLLFPLHSSSLTHSSSFQVVIRSRLDQSMEEVRELKVNRCRISDVILKQ